MQDMISRIYQLIERRKSAGEATSYSAQLLARGRTHIAKKLGEEAIETALAASAGDAAHTVAESADMLYHLCVLWHALGITPEDVAGELARREAQSGLEEKAARSAEGT